MNYHIFEGEYTVQSGHKKDIAIIKCPFFPKRIEVYDAHGLQILHGAQVYWTEIGRYQKRKETIIQAVVVGLKNCQYIIGGKQIICTLRIVNKNSSQSIIIEALPIETKLPHLQVINGEFLLDKFQCCPKEGNNFLQKILIIQKKYFWVRIIGWQYLEDKPRAIVVSIFHDNDAKTTEVETEVILNSLSIRQHFLLNLQENKTQQYSQQEYDHQLPKSKFHKQFNDIIFTIDPQTSIDIQDALSLKVINNLPNKQNQYEIGVHISDVGSYSYLFEDIRHEIAQKGSSVYLPHKVIHMLPQNIVNMCRLTPKKYRLVFSVFFRVDSNGKLIGQAKFQKNIVKSLAKLSYQQSEEIIQKNTQDLRHIVDKHKITQEQFDQLSKKIKLLKKISFERRKNRLKFRQITQLFNKSQITFKLDEKNFPTQIGLKKRLESQKLIQQFMILANQLVAKKLVKDYGENSLIIYHPQPTKYSISHLNDVISDFGVRFTTDNVVNMEKEIGNLLGREGLRDQIKQLLIIRAMQIQQHASYTRYLNSSKGHFGLNLECYTHFTSPLRRFADIIVHEQLEECLKIKGEKHNNKGWRLQKLIKQIDSANKSRFRNKKLKQKITECFLNMLLYRQNKKIKAKGLILSLGLKSVTIYVPIYNIIKQIQWNHQVQYGEKDSIKVFIKNTQIFQTFNHFQLHRNDSVDIQIRSWSHQQVKITIIFPKKINL